MPRIGGLLLAVLVTAAGIAPIIPWGHDSETFVTGAKPELTIQPATQPASEAAATPSFFPGPWNVAPAADAVPADETAAEVPAVVEESIP